MISRPRVSSSAPITIAHQLEEYIDSLLKETSAWVKVNPLVKQADQPVAAGDELDLASPTKDGAATDS